ncbi:hypothetical protein AB0E67_11420 [Streptomyces sp. NPDC032161]|uniref:hypothetical protein n=1 Tax=unclassified Streptomyces TaxID=2593676 RepID=UPI0033D05C4A
MKGQPGTAGPKELIAHATEVLRGFWRGRRVVLLAHRVTTSTLVLADELATCGATVAAVVSGTPPAPGALPGVPRWSMAGPGTPVERHEFDAWLREPPGDLAAWLDDLDPDGSCLAVGTIWTEVEKFCGRAVHGWRRPEWAHWEDKTRIEELWAATGVPSPRHAVLDLADPTLRKRAALLDTGRGVVLAMDSTAGIQGAGRALRWVRHPHELDSALREFAGRTHRVRVAEFVAGVPCSTQALAMDDGIAVFDPAEEAMLRSPDTGAFFYCGTSTWWRPGPGVREEIERHVHRAGRYLIEHTGFRGIFTVDGLLTPDGFRATELNPRAGGGLGVRSGLPGFPVYLFHRAVQERLPGIADLAPRHVEEAFCDAIRRRPSYSGTVAPGPGARIALDGREFTATGGAVIRYRIEDGAADVLEIRPTSGDRLIGPAMAEFAAALGTPGLVSCTDDGVRGTLRGTSSGERP